MKITDVTLSILRTELEETVIPTHGAVDAMPPCSGFGFHRRRYRRELLFATFGVWQESDAPVAATAEALVCHPNTVRYRLRRIEKRTGRSLSRPRDVAELCLVLEVQRRLM